jgi:hypothetical protein
VEPYLQKKSWHTALQNECKWPDLLDDDAFLAETNSSGWRKIGPRNNAVMALYQL